MTCQHCGSWQANLDSRYCARCGAGLPVYDDPPLAATGLRFAEPPPPIVTPPPAARPPRDTDWLRHPGTWAIAATALLVAGIVLAAVILSGGSNDGRQTATGRTDSASPAAATSAPPTPATSTQTVIVVPAAPGSPAETRTVTVGPPPTEPVGSADQAFGDATSVSASYYQRGDTVFFDSPSHNIGCRLVAYGSQAQCTIESYDFSEPGYDCDLGAGVLMNSAGSPVIDCIHNPPYGGSEAVLEFGDAVTFGDFSCVSRSDGITCLDSYGSGFTMGRKAYVEY